MNEENISLIRLETLQRDPVITLHRVLGLPCDANAWEAMVKTDPSRASWCCPEMVPHLHICSGHWSNLQRSIQCAGSYIRQSSQTSSSLLSAALTHLFSSARVRVCNWWWRVPPLWYRSLPLRPWTRLGPGVDRKVRRCRNRWIINSTPPTKRHNRGYLCPTVWMKPVSE